MRLPLLLTLAMLAGCSQKPVAKPPPTLGEVAQSVHSNLAVHAEFAVAGKLDRVKQTHVELAKKRWAIAYRLALEAANGDTRWPAPVDVVKTADELKELTAH